MIKLHPMVDDKNFDIEIEKAVKNANLSGYVSKKTLKLFFNLFSWVYIEGNTNEAFYSSDNSKLKAFINRFDLFRFKGESLCYSSVLFYQKLNRTINLRLLSESSLISEYQEGDNKLLEESDFSYKSLYDLYKEGIGDISPNLLLFNGLFNSVPVKTVVKLYSYSDVVRARSFSDIVRPDFPYKLATKQLEINKNLEIDVEKGNKLFILQDSTKSMEAFIPELKAIKAFILNEAFVNNYEIEWLAVSDKINSREFYTKENIKNKKVSFTFSGFKIDLRDILSSNEIKNKKVVIITDGTDSFDFPFKTKTKDINVISFNDNTKIKNKISNYGRFFKT
jgi:hypothetical protein